MEFIKAGELSKMSKKWIIAWIALLGIIAFLVFVQVANANHPGDPSPNLPMKAQVTCTLEAQNDLLKYLDFKPQLRVLMAQYFKNGKCLEHSPPLEVAVGDYIIEGPSCFRGHKVWDLKVIHGNLKGRVYAPYIIFNHSDCVEA